MSCENRNVSSVVNAQQEMKMYLKQLRLTSCNLTIFKCLCKLSFHAVNFTYVREYAEVNLKN